MVEDSDSYNRSGGEIDTISPFLYSTIFSESCPYYMSIGMTYDEFWYGEADRVIFYREAEKKRRDNRNFESWLMGNYIYEAILDAAPTLNPMSKNPNPVPYRDRPYPLTDKQSKLQKKLEEEKKVKNGRDAFLGLMSQVNKKRAKQ